ncbi:MAG: prepilin-type N-terminal cleavage/methylation domain-containing protein [Pirellula sp.]
MTIDRPVKGFTLVELLVSSTIGFVLILILLGLLVQQNLQLVKLVGYRILRQIRIATHSDRLTLDHLAIDDQLHSVNSVGNRAYTSEPLEPLWRSSSRCTWSA